MLLLLLLLLLLPRLALCTWLYIYSLELARLLTKTLVVPASERNNGRAIPVAGAYVRVYGGGIICCLVPHIRSSSTFFPPASSSCRRRCFPTGYRRAAAAAAALAKDLQRLSIAVRTST